MLARELVMRRPDVLFGGATLTVRALKQATTEIPIITVTVASDPLRSGIVSNLAHPEANVTGLAPMTFDLTAKRIDVLNKIDLVSGAAPGKRDGAVHVSAKTGAGLDALRAELLEAAGWNARGESVFLARERHLRALEQARARLAAAAAQDAHWEFFAEELRLAQEALGAITGQVSADDLLGEIFSRFCIGK